MGSEKMEIEWSINQKQGFVHLKYNGNPDFEHWAEVMTEIFSHADFKSGIGFVADLTESEAPDADHLKSVKDFLISHKEKLKGARWANITAQRPVHYGITRMAQVYIEDLPWQLNAFLSEKEAIEWATEPVKKKVH